MKFKIGKDLAGKISLTTNIPFILLMAVMGLVSTNRLDKELTNLAERNRENTLKISVQLIQNEIDGAVKNYLRAVAEKNRELLSYYNLQVSKNRITMEQARAEARRIMLDPDYGRIGTTGYLAGVSTSGILTIHPKSEGADASGHEFMKKAMAMKNGYLEYEWKNPGEEKARIKAGYLSYYKPWDIMVWASSYKEEFETLLDYEQIRRSIENIKAGNRGFLMLIDKSGSVVAGKQLFLDNYSNEAEGLKNLADMTAEVIKNEKGSYSYNTGYGEVIADFTRIPDSSWYAAVNDFTAEYMNVIKIFRLIIFISIITASIIVSLFIKTLMSRILLPMKNIQSVSTMAASGDLTGRINITSNDEMGELASFFNNVIDSFSALVKKIQNASEVLIESTHSLGAGTQEVSSTANQQAASVKEILSTMEDSDKLSQGVAVRIQEVVKIANNTKETVEKGFDHIKNSLGKMSEIRETNANTIGGIKTLGGQIDSIWDIVNIINGIADQTKIIAFNAELEAAAAGDAGRNFQIVASEIRRLADSTVDSTNEIKTKINEIQHASDKLIIASEEGTMRIKEGWDISHHIRGVFEDVLSSSEISAASANDIARAIKMQVASFEQIFLTLKQISEGIDNFVISTRSTSEASDQLKVIADQFNESVARYSVSEEK